MTNDRTGSKEYPDFCGAEADDDSQDGLNEDLDQGSSLFYQLFEPAPKDVIRVPNVVLEELRPFTEAQAVTFIMEAHETGRLGEAGGAGEPMAAAGKDKQAPPREVIELARLDQERQQEIDRIRELQGIIVQFASRLRFSGSEIDGQRYGYLDEEGEQNARKAFLERLTKELGEPAEGQQGKFHKLPEFGKATKEGYKRLKEFFEKGHLPDLLGALDKEVLAIPPGFPLQIAGKQEEILKSSEQLRQEIRDHKAFLDVDPTRLEDVRKLSRITDWIASAETRLHQNYIDRLERYLSHKLEKGITEGIYRQGWRRPEGMDKETWCAALEQTMNVYTRMTKVIEAIDYLNKSGTGFESEALDHLPPGMKEGIQRDGRGKILSIDFGQYTIEDLSLQSDANRQKLDPLMAWCDRFEAEARQGLNETLKRHEHVAGFGEYEVRGGWVDPKTKAFKMDVEQQPGGDFKKFNLLSYDMTIKHDLDAFGKVRKVFVSPDVAFQEVPPFGYLNSFARDIERVRAEKSVPYEPDDYVAVQTGPYKIEMVKAKDLADWKLRHQIKDYSEKAITLTMDTAMVVTGFGELMASRKVVQLGAKEAVSIGAQVMKTEVALQLPRGIAASMVRQGVFEICLGLTGILHNAGANDIAALRAVSNLRTAYFLGHAAYSVSQIFRLPEATKAAAELVSPRLVCSADGLITSIRGTEDFLRAGQLAKIGALEKMPVVKGIDWLSHGAFNVSEAAFVGMFIWDVVGVSQHFSAPYRPKALDIACKAFTVADLADASAVQKFIEVGNKPSERAQNYMTRFMETLPNLKGKSRQECETILTRAAELAKPGASEDDKQAFLNDLMRYFRYDGKTIAALQMPQGNPQFKEKQLSERQLTAKAQMDRDNFDPDVRKMAALAILTLSRKSDGTWPKNLAGRSQIIPRFKELILMDEAVVEVEVGPTPIVQTLTAEELVNLLHEDLRNESSLDRRTDKAASLHELGLTSSQHLGDLLLLRIEGKQAVSKEERCRAIADLSGLISRLKVEEQLREARLDHRDAFAAKGLTAGMQSQDLIKRLERAAVESDDKDVRATALLSLTLLKKASLDNTDKNRIRDFFLKEPSGITEEQLKQVLAADAASTPTDKAGWERKLIAAETRARLSMVHDAGSIDKKALEHLLGCLATAQDQPEIAARALSALTAKDRLGGCILDVLEQCEPQQKWRNKLAVACLNNLNLPYRGLDAAGQLEAAKARLQFIEQATTLLKESDDKLLKGQLRATLSSRAGIQSEAVEEIRVAALKAMAELGTGGQVLIDLLKRAVNQKTEPCGAVRLAAVETIERLVPGNRARREILAPIAVAEQDPAVREKLARYYDPTGSIRDRNSRRSRQELAEAKTEQNKIEFKPADIDAMVSARYKKLAGSKNIFDYFDADKAPVETSGVMQAKYTTLGKLWDSKLWLLDDGVAGSIARRTLFELELDAQNCAIQAYSQGIDELESRAMKGSGKEDIPLGKDKLISERDAAILTLGCLVRQGSRMETQVQSGDQTKVVSPFCQHRNAYDRNMPNPPLRPYSSLEIQERRKYAQEHDLDFHQGDPWPSAERGIAEKMRNLCSQSSDTVNLKLLSSEILRALKSDAKTLDASRCILVAGLDRLLSNPDSAPETRREILKAVAEMVKNSREVEKDKTAGTIAMIGLLDKHGKAAFETYGDAYAAMRTAVVSRGQNDRMPSQLRLRAQEMFDRQWLSVLAEADRIPAQQGNQRTLAEFLPKNFEALEKAKEGKTDGYDEDVHDAVQRIILATKGLPLGPEDLRRTTLATLADAKYDDRVRMAALLALSQGKAEEQSHTQTALMDLAINSMDRSIRQDAARLLLSMPGVEASSGLLEEGRLAVLEKLAACQAKTVHEISGRDRKSMLADANELIEKNLRSNDPRVVVSARQLQEQVHRYSEGLALLANLKARDKAKQLEAEQLFELSLLGFGLKAIDVEKLQPVIRSGEFEHASEHGAVQEQCRSLLNSLQESGAVPAALSALNGYAKVLVERTVVNGKINVDIMEQAIAVASLGHAIADVYYPEGSPGRIDQYRNAAEVYGKLAEKPLYIKQESATSLRSKWHDQVQKFLSAQAKELEHHKRISEAQIKSVRAALDTVHESQKQQLLDDQIQARFQLLKLLLSRADLKSSTYVQERIRHVSTSLEQDLSLVKDKNSFSYKHQRFIKDWLDLGSVPAEKKEQAKAKAEASLEQAFGIAVDRYGRSSLQYEQLLAKQWQFHKQQGQPDRAEAFFKTGLQNTSGDFQMKARLVVLRQFYAFLMSQNRKDEASRIATEYHALGKH